MVLWCFFENMFLTCFYGFLGLSVFALVFFEWFFKVFYWVLLIFSRVLGVLWFFVTFLSCFSFPGFLWFLGLLWYFL